MSPLSAILSRVIHAILQETILETAAATIQQWLISNVLREISRTVLISTSRGINKLLHQKETVVSTIITYVIFIIIWPFILEILIIIIIIIIRVNYIFF